MTFTEPTEHMSRKHMASNAVDGQQNTIKILWHSWAGQMIWNMHAEASFLPIYCPWAFLDA